MKASLLAKSILCLAVAAVAGCATTSGLRENSPVAEVTTNKRADVYAGCVSEGWQNAGADAVSYVPGESSASLIVNGPSGVTLLLDVRPEGNHWRAVMRSHLWIGDSKFAAVVRKCA